MWFLLLEIFLLALDDWFDLLEGIFLFRTIILYLLMGIQQGRTVTRLTGVIVGILPFDLRVICFKLPFILFIYLHNGILIFGLGFYLPHLLLILFWKHSLLRILRFQLVTMPNTVYLQGFFLFVLVQLLLCYLPCRIWRVLSALFASHQTAVLR